MQDALSCSYNRCRKIHRLSRVPMQKAVADGVKGRGKIVIALLWEMFIRKSKVRAIMSSWR